MTSGIPLGLLGFAAGAMGAGAATDRPVGFGQALGNALQGGLQNYGLLSQVEGQKTNQQMRQMLMMQQMAQQKRQADQEAARDQYLQQYASTLPEDQRALPMLAPDAFVDAKVKSTFEGPKAPEFVKVDEGAQTVTYFVDPKSGELKPFARAPRFAPQQPREDPLVEVFDPNSPTGTKFVPRSQAAGMPGKPGSQGVRIEYDSEGRPILSVGGRAMPGGGATPLTGAQESRIQDDIDIILDQQARVARIGEYWRPEFQQLGSRLGAAWTAGREKLGFEIDPADQQQLAEFTNAKAAALADLNRTLQELSGAAVTESEAGRFQGELPSPGTGIFDGDSPTEFAAKLRARQRDLRLALARKAHLLREGIPHNIAEGDTGGVSIDQMPRIIDERGAALEQQFVSEGLSVEEAQQRAEQQLRQEFGL